MGYYQGDYYVGDPGFLSFLKKGASFAAGFIPGVGGIASRALSKIPVPARRVVGQATRAIIKHPVLSGAAAAGAVGAVAGAGIESRGSSMTPAAMGQMHIRVPGTIRQRMRNDRMIGGPRPRRMRVTNPKALRRAIRRTHGFAKLAMKTIHLVHPKKKVRFGGFKTRRKK